MRRIARDRSLMLALALLLAVLPSCRERRPPQSEGFVKSPASALPPAVSAKQVSAPHVANAADELLDEDSIWRSAEACQRAVSARRRAPRGAGTARIATWNVRWYPDGRPGRQPSGAGTDIAWLACAIAWLDVDAVAVQEFKAHARARAKSDQLVAALDEHTGGRWKLVLDDCRGGDAGQHVGILYDSKRVSAGEPLVLAALNPHGQPCKDQLRPGLGLYLRFAGGLDLHLVSVHLKSGSERRSLDLRARSVQALPEAIRELRARSPDADVIVAGDFNTMGCRRCKPKLTASDELTALGRALDSLSPALRRVEPSVGCSEYYADGSGLLDHFLVTTETRELAASTRATVSGFCGDAACAKLPGRDKPSVSSALSDHCPVVLELSDRDLD